MKIETIKNQYTIKNNFKAGKVRVFADFDRTFLPAKHGDFQFNENSNFVNYIRKYFAEFTAFLNRNKEGMKFSITTGRTFGEFQRMGEIAQKRQIKMPFPDTLICKNGSDEYVKIGTDEEFYNGGNFPFSYDVTNKEKEQKIKELSGWDGPKLIEKMKQLYKSMNFTIVEGDSEHGVKDYGAHSLFSEGKLRDERGIVYHGTDKSDWNVGFRKDGNCKIFVTYPYDMFNVEERRNAYLELNSKISKIFEEVGVKHYTYSNQYHHECGGRPYDVWEPVVDPQCMSGLDYRDRNGLNKLYDPKEAVKKAKETNDLVIVAGDGSNDEIMLNPFLYMDEILTQYDDHAHHIYTKRKSANKMVEFMDNNLELAEKFKKLPFIGIVVKPKHEDSNLQNLIDAYGQGEYRKIIVVEEGHLEDGIKEAIKLYSEQNPEYKAKLNSDLRHELYPDAADTEPQKPTGGGPKKPDDGDGEKKNNKIKYIIGGVIVAIIGAFTICKIKKNKEKVKNENSTDYTTNSEQKI